MYRGQRNVKHPTVSVGITETYFQMENVQVIVISHQLIMFMQNYTLSQCTCQFY